MTSRQACFCEYIKLALISFFGNVNSIGDALTEIEFCNNLNGSIPYTRDDGPKTSPVVVMGWQGQPNDLICLAHEVAHAVQINLSGHAFMPPMAREVCAFLGELVLLGWLHTHDKALFASLLRVWRTENERYLGEHAEFLAAGLLKPTAPYKYAMNYPLARIMAVHVFENWSPKRIMDLFSSGQNAVQLLPFELLAKFETAAHLAIDLPKKSVKKEELTA